MHRGQQDIAVNLRIFLTHLHNPPLPVKSFPIFASMEYKQRFSGAAVQPVLPQPYAALFIIIEVSPNLVP